MKKYVEEIGNEFKIFESKDEALKSLRSDWGYLTASEKKNEENACVYEVEYDDNLDINDADDIADPKDYMTEMILDYLTQKAKRQNDDSVCFYYDEVVEMKNWMTLDATDFEDDEVVNEYNELIADADSIEELVNIWNDYTDRVNDGSMFEIR